MTTTFVQNQAFFKDLTAVLTGQLLLPDDAAYERVRHLWNGKVKTQPTAIVRCMTVQDVIHTVRWTRLTGLPLSVRGGGHDFAGRALVKNGIVIDLSQMRAVTIDPDALTAQVQGGATAGDLIGAWVGNSDRNRLQRWDVWTYLGRGIWSADRCLWTGCR